MVETPPGKKICSNPSLGVLTKSITVLWVLAIQGSPRGNGGGHSLWSRVDQPMGQGIRHNVQVASDDPPRGEVPLIRNGRQGDLPFLGGLHDL